MFFSYSHREANKYIVIFISDYLSYIREFDCTQRDIQNTIVKYLDTRLPNLYWRISAQLWCSFLYGIFKVFLKILRKKEREKNGAINQTLHLNLLRYLLYFKRK